MGYASKKSDSSDFKQSVASRLKAACDQRGLSGVALSKDGKFANSTVNNWMNGVSSPSAEFLAYIQNLGVDVAYILTGIHTTAHVAAEPSPAYRTLSGPAPSPDSEDDVFHVPVMATTASMGCGKDQLDTDVVVRDVRFSKKWLERNAPHSRLEALRLIGSDGVSMQGTINDGDLSLVDTDVRTTDIPGVYVLVVAGLTFIKRVSIKLDGSKVVSSDNPDDQLTEVLRGGEQLDVRGMVVYGWNGRRL